MKTSFITLLIVALAQVQFAIGQNNWTIESRNFVFSNAPFQQCHASTIVETDNGNIMVACFGGTGEGNTDVKIWMRIFDAGSWSAPYMMANGGGSGKKLHPTWNPVLFKSRTGKLFLFYKVGPNPREWWGLVKTNEKGSSSWKDEGRLPGSLLGPIKNKPVQLANGNILSPSSTETNDQWKVHVEISTDDGNSWSRHDVDSSATFKVIQPTILQYAGNRLQMLCRSNQEKIVESWSEDGGKTWSKLALTNIPNPNSGIDAVTLQDGTQMLVYNPTTAGKNWWDGRATLSIATSKNGKDWQHLLDLEKGSKGEFSYPAIIQGKDGKVHITYTYDRKNIMHVVLNR